MVANDRQYCHYINNGSCSILFLVGILQGNNHNEQPTVDQKVDAATERY